MNRYFFQWPAKETRYIPATPPRRYPLFTGIKWNCGNAIVIQVASCRSSLLSCHVLRSGRVVTGSWVVGRRSRQKEADVSSSVIFLLALKDHMEQSSTFSLVRSRAHTCSTGISSFQLFLCCDARKASGRAFMPRRGRFYVCSPCEIRHPSSRSLIFRHSLSRDSKIRCSFSQIDGCT